MSKYIGNRYVPLYCGKWDKTKSYESLSVVIDDEGNSYTSIKNVPSQIELTDTNFWVLSGIFNLQYASLKEETEIIKTETENNKNMILDIEISPLEFGCVGDGITDDTINFEKCVDYCIDNKKTMQITPGYIFAITSIKKELPVDNGFTMRGNGQQSVIKIINTTGDDGITFKCGGNFRSVDIGNFKIIGNSDCGNGIVIIRGVRPSRIYNIIGTNFINTGKSPVKLIDCIDLQYNNCYSRKVSNGLILEGQCDRIDINKITVYDWSEYGVNVIPKIETSTGLLENSLCLSIYEPYFYGTGELSTNYENKIALNLIDCEKFSLYGGWFEQCEFALKGANGEKNIGCPNSLILNPKRGGSYKPKIFLEKSSNSFILSPSMNVELSSNCENCFVISSTLLSVTENGKNNVLSNDGFNISRNCIINGRGGNTPIVTEGLSYKTISLSPNDEKTFNLNNTVGTIEIISVSSRGLVAKYHYRVGNEPFNYPLLSNESIVTGNDLIEYTESKLNISFNSDKSIKIVNKTVSTKTLKIILN